MKEYKNEESNLNIKYYDNFLSVDLANKYFRILETHLTYNGKEESQVVISGKKIDIPRKQTSYGDPNTYYQFSGNKVMAKNWNHKEVINELSESEYKSYRLVCLVLKDIVKRIKDVTGNDYNFVLINRYKDGNDYIGYHFDDERNLDANKGIIGVSLGEPRNFLFQHKDSKEIIDIKLSHGSMVHIDFPTNSSWRHSIPKRTGANKPRISLTFRKMKI